MDVPARRGRARDQQHLRAVAPGRGAVIRRKLSFGSNNGSGMRFLERILSVSETWRLHQINLLDYLTRAIIALRENRPAPRLLPTQ